MSLRTKIIITVAAVVIVIAGIFILYRVHNSRPQSYVSQEAESSQEAEAPREAAYVLEDVAYPPEFAYSQEYAAGTGNIKGGVDTAYFAGLSEDFEIGANKDGYAVFKDPAAAYAAFLKNYGAGLALIQRECGLEPLSHENYGMYKAYGWQVTTGTEEERRQAAFVSSFMDIYENSFDVR